jgi:hypothetical protein
MCEIDNCKGKTFRSKENSSFVAPTLELLTLLGPDSEPAALSMYWPNALEVRINNGTANVIHIRFKKEALKDAICQFSHARPPKGTGLGI